MKINVSLPTGSVVSPEVEGTDTVDSVTHQVHHLAREPKPHPTQQILYFAGQRLERQRTLAFYEIGKEAQLQLRVIPQDDRRQAQCFWHRDRDDAGHAAG